MGVIDFKIIKTGRILPVTLDISRVSYKNAGSRISLYTVCAFMILVSSASVSAHKNGYS